MDYENLRTDKSFNKNNFNVLRILKSKEEINFVILNTIDKVLVLRFGRETDIICMQLDEMVNKI